jgi:hypothetical protein
MARKLVEASRPKVTRPFFVPPLLDFDQNVLEYDKKYLMRRSRQAFSNNPLVRAVIQQRAMFSTKNGWEFQSLVLDKEWRKSANEYFDKFSRVACVNDMDWYQLIYQLCISVDRDGDGFVMLTESKNGFPQLQFIPANRIGGRDDEEIVSKGKYTGYKMVSGIIVSKYGKALAYNILADNPADDKIVDAVNMIHIFDSESGESVRGIPLVSHTLQALEDLQASRDAELVAQQMFSKTALIEKLGPEDDDSLAFLKTNCGPGPTNSQTPLYEEFKDGQIVVYRSQNSDLQALEANRPSMNYQTYRDKINQEIVVSLNWSTSMLDGSDKSSVENRVNLRVAEITVSDRINMLTPHLKKIVFYVLSKGIANGQLAPIEKFWECSFSRPPFITSDMSKMENSTRENLKAGITNLTQIIEADGNTLERHLREQFTEQALAQLIKAEVEQQYGVVLTPPVAEQKSIQPI